MIARSATDGGGVMPVTVRGADAGGAVPSPVTSALVTFCTVPGVDDVIVTTIVQPPTGSDAPAGSATCVVVTVTPAQVPALPDVVVTPAGIVSTNVVARIAGVALPLPSASVSVAEPPAAMVAGAMVLASVGGVPPPPPPLRRSLSLALPDAPEAASVTVAVLTSGSVVMPAAKATGTFRVSTPVPAPSCAPVTPALVPPTTPCTVPQLALAEDAQVTVPAMVTPAGSGSLTVTATASLMPVFATLIV